MKRPLLSLIFVREKPTHKHFDVASFLDHQNIVSPEVCLHSAFFILSFKEEGLRKGELGMKSKEQWVGKVEADPQQS